MRFNLIRDILEKLKDNDLRSVDYSSILEMNKIKLDILSKIVGSDNLTEDEFKASLLEILNTCEKLLSVYQRLKKEILRNITFQ